MEIPYTVTARPDTGLWNAKIGIWLFLASEVMLFGGLFSSYVFLRIGADYPWPVHELGVLPGFINTFVLILSSVTVVFAWAFLKMRQYGKYRICMGLTLLCALMFLGIKSYEYYGKFTHWAVRLPDGSVLDGHHPKQNIDFHEVTAINVDLRKSEVGFLERAGAVNGSFKLPDGTVVEGYKVALKKLRESADQGNVRLVVEGAPLKFSAERRHVASYLGNELTFRDGTRLEGVLHNDSLVLEVSGFDLRQVKGLQENLDAGDSAMIWKYLGEENRQVFLHHKSEVLTKFEESKNKGLASDDTDRRLPQTYGEIMRKAYKGDHLGPDPDAHIHKEITLPASEATFFSNYSPRLNTYYAIYFLMSGLHGLHVIGGALVLGHFFFFGRRLYDKNPEHLANRVEVGGLFWHFVDLVWIFLFPVFYLL
jgi:heme/copper-type cytochrome/quinol oxidase subunit 3